MVDYANIYHSLENINKVPEIVKEAYKFSMGNQILIYTIILIAAFIITFIAYLKSETEKSDILETSICLSIGAILVAAVILNFPTLYSTARNSDRATILNTNEDIKSNARKFLPPNVTIDKFKSDVDKLKTFCQNYYSTSDNTFCRVYLANGYDDTINKVMNRMYNTDYGKSTQDIDNAIKFIEKN